MKITGVIFDFDGTLANTFPLIFLAFRTTLKKFTGRDFSDAEIAEYFGPTEEGIFRRLVPDEWKAALEVYLAEYQSHHMTHARLFPGMLDHLKLLRSKRLKTAIISGKGPETLAISVEAFKLKEYFDALAGGSPEKANKDANIPKVVTQWGLKPGEVIYVGDTAPDIIAARAAGVVPVGVYWSETAVIAKLRAQNPAGLFGEVKEFNDWVIRQIEY